MTPIELGLLAGVGLLSFTVQAVTGFGGTLTALVVAGLFLPLELVIPPLVALSLVVNLYFVSRAPRAVAWRILLRHVFPLMGAGVVVGWQVADAIEGAAFRRVFGVFVMVVAGRELWLAWRTARRGVPPRPALSAPPAPWLLAAGLVHGVYATGGPPLVYALSRVELDKTALRATLCAIWIVIDSALTVAFVLDGRFGEGGWAAPIVMFPSMVVAIGLGSWIHGRIDPVRFRLAVYVLLIVLASSLVFRG